MHQESKVVALRLAPDKREPARDKPATARSVLPREFAEDLRWVLRQLHGVDTARPECEESDHSGTRRWIWTSMATAALIAAGASLWIVAANEHPSDWRQYLRHLGSTSPLPSGTPTHGTQASGGDSREARATLDLLRIEDATRVQQRLIELGFLVGKPNGIWGPRSRQALREFKAAHALVPDGHWNANIQARLFDVNAQRKAERAAETQSREPAHMQRAASVPPPGAAVGKQQALTAAETFMGTWASDAAECRPAQGGGIRISRRRAEGHGAACSFGPIEREGSGWRVSAVCAGNGTAWNANINLAVSGDRLQWSSERGTAVYVRCSSG